jgi:hypothetical protein
MPNPGLSLSLSLSLCLSLSVSLSLSLCTCLPCLQAWDVDGSGTLTTADIELMSKANQGKKARPNLLSMSRRRGKSGSCNSLEGANGEAFLAPSAVTKRQHKPIMKSFSQGSISQLYSPTNSFNDISAAKIHPVLGINDTPTTDILEGKEKDDVQTEKTDDNNNAVGFDDKW